MPYSGYKLMYAQGPQPALDAEPRQSRLRALGAASRVGRRGDAQARQAPHLQQARVLPRRGQLGGARLRPVRRAGQLYRSTLRQHDRTATTCSAVNVDNYAFYDFSVGRVHSWSVRSACRTACATSSRCPELQWSSEVARRRRYPLTACKTRRPGRTPRPKSAPCRLRAWHRLAPVGPFPNCRIMNIRRITVVAALALALATRSAGARGAGFVDLLDAPAPDVAAREQDACCRRCARAGDRLVAVGQRGHIVVSNDGGATWKQSPVPVSSDLTAVYFVNDKQGLGRRPRRRDPAHQRWRRHLDAAARRPRGQRALVDATCERKAAAQADAKH